MRRNTWAAAVALIALLGAGETASAGKATLDAKLFALYKLYDPITHEKLTFLVCGSLPGAFGCFGGYNFPEVHSPCAVVEGAARQKDNVVTREIYVFDKRASKEEALLDVYVRTDTITDDSDDINVTLTAQLSTGIAADAKAKCFMAASPNTVYVGVNTSATAAAVSIATGKIKNVVGFGSVQEITADGRGYVTVSSEGGFDTYDPDGKVVTGGGGTVRMVNTSNAIVHN